MLVDIVFERIKEELYKGRSVKSAYEEGCKKSTSAILDTNITLLLASMVLYFFGRQLVMKFCYHLINIHSFRFNYYVLDCSFND